MCTSKDHKWICYWLSSDWIEKFLTLAVIQLRRFVEWQIQGQKRKEGNYDQPASLDQRLFSWFYGVASTGRMGEKQSILDIRNDLLGFGWSLPPGSEMKSSMPVNVSAMRICIWIPWRAVKHTENGLAMNRRRHVLIACGCFIMYMVPVHWYLQFMHIYIMYEQLHCGLDMFEKVSFLLYTW